MHRASTFAALVIATCTTALYPVEHEARQAVEQNWPQWRGPSASGIAVGNPPTTWSERENVKEPIPMDSGACHRAS